VSSTVIVLRTKLASSKSVEILAQVPVVQMPSVGFLLTIQFAVVLMDIQETHFHHVDQCLLQVYKFFFAFL